MGASNGTIVDVTFNGATLDVVAEPEPVPTPALGIIGRSAAGLILFGAAIAMTRRRLRVVN